MKIIATAPRKYIAELSEEELSALAACCSTIFDQNGNRYQFEGLSIVGHEIDVLGILRPLAAFQAKRTEWGSHVAGILRQLADEAEKTIKELGPEPPKYEGT